MKSRVGAWATNFPRNSMPWVRHGVQVTGVTDPGTRTPMKPGTVGKTRSGWWSHKQSHNYGGYSRDSYKYTFSIYIYIHIYIYIYIYDMIWYDIIWYDGVYAATLDLSWLTVVWGCPSQKKKWDDGSIDWECHFTRRKADISGSKNAAHTGNGSMPGRASLGCVSDMI